MTQAVGHEQHECPNCGDVLYDPWTGCINCGFREGRGGVSPVPLSTRPQYEGGDAALKQRQEKEELSRSLARQLSTEEIEILDSRPLRTLSGQERRPIIGKPTKKKARRKSSNKSRVERAKDNDQTLSSPKQVPPTKPPDIQEWLNSLPDVRGKPFKRWVPEVLESLNSANMHPDGQRDFVKTNCLNHHDICDKLFVLFNTLKQRYTWPGQQSHESTEGLVREVFGLCGYSTTNHGD